MGSAQCCSWLVDDDAGSRRLRWLAVLLVVMAVGEAASVAVDWRNMLSGEDKNGLRW